MPSSHLPSTGLPRVLIVGGGFAGLKLAQSLDSRLFQVVLLDRNNYHQFPPLIYQVASSGLEPSTIAFPFRSAFHRKGNFYFRLATLERIDVAHKRVQTDIGAIDYDFLVLACGATTNFFGNERIAAHALPMKTLNESVRLRNVLLQRLEQAVCASEEERQELLNIVVVGGGPTGVEIAGALAEMKRYVVPKDYPDLGTDLMRITLLDASPRILAAMSEQSSAKALRGLQELGVEVCTDTFVDDYDGRQLSLRGGRRLATRSVIWVSGIVANETSGLTEASLGRGRRIVVDAYNRVEGYEDVFALGDQCIMTTDANYPQGHPQMAQVALQQAKLLAENLKRLQAAQAMKGFMYKDLGSMATIGRNRAVAEIGRMKWGGFTAWVLWLVVHLRSILSVRNKLVVLLNWVWNYFTYDRSLRIILKQDTEREIPGSSE
ncbi:MAG: NAD(P)/FAD-dependent oxidoreductase [Bacteroides sp.]|nr:NAD(P)/FAD-dependent oxidoreductase [Bacteroides sp.]